MDINIKNIDFSYKNLNIFENLNLTIKKGRVTVILGPSGCGKTTLLNLISGVISPQNGIIEIPKNLKLSYLFQEPRLLPWKNVKNNIEFVLDSLDKNEKKSRIEHYLKEMELKKFKDYYPNQLSGGMKQRVAIARAFAFPSNTILMDEPFKGLDLPLKLNLFKLFNRVWREDERTAVFVTHDIKEAVQLGDDIIVLTKRPSQIKKIYRNDNSDPMALERELYNLII